MPVRFYVACLASYNNGILHGAWIDASADVEAMQEGITAMLKASKVPGAEEYAVHDYDGLPSSLGEYPGLEAIAEYVELIEEAEDKGIPPEVVAKVVNNFGSVSEAHDAIVDNYQGTHDSLTAFAEQLMDDCGDLKDVPEHIARYFDYEAYGRDLELGGDVWTIRHEGDLYVFWNR